MNLSVSIASMWVVGAALACPTPHANAASSASAQISPSAKIAQCNFPAFVQESDPAGLNVRQAAGLDGKVIGVLPSTVASRELDGLQVRIALDVLAVNDGWFQITHAVDNPALTGQAARKVFAGRGWVSGKKLTVKSQAKVAYASPSTSAAMVFKLQDDGSFDSDEMVQAGQLIGCQGQWALVEWSRDKLSSDMRQQVQLPASGPNLPVRFRAWVNQLCGVQESSCDGLAQQK